MRRYFIINKPYEMLSQFVGGSPGLRMLGDLSFAFPDGTHAIGRLDYQSEGLLLATTDSRITKLLFESKVKHTRSYLVQAYKVMTEETVERLRTGVPIFIKGGQDYMTTPCEVMRVERPSGLWTAMHELRADIPQTWAVITLTEGKFRQVRKMLTAVRHRCQRLVRISIEDMHLGDLMPGEVMEIDQATFFHQLRLEA